MAINRSDHQLQTTTSPLNRRLSTRPIFGEFRQITAQTLCISSEAVRSPWAIFLSIIAYTAMIRILFHAWVPRPQQTRDRNSDPDLHDIIKMAIHDHSGLSILWPVECHTIILVLSSEGSYCATFIATLLWRIVSMLLQHLGHQ